MYVCCLTGEKMLKAREGIQYGRGEDQSVDALRAKFNDYCPVQKIPYEENPFFTCVERAGRYPAGESEKYPDDKIIKSNLICGLTCSTQLHTFFFC